METNGSFSAAFCESAALRETGSPSQSPTVTALPKGEPLAKPVTLRGLPRAPTLGELANPQDLTERARTLAGELASVARLRWSTNKKLPRRVAGGAFIFLF